MHYVDEQIQGFKINLKPEKKSKLSSVVLRMRGIDQVTFYHGILLLPSIPIAFLRLVYTYKCGFDVKLEQFLFSFPFLSFCLLVFIILTA